MKKVLATLLFLTTIFFLLTIKSYAQYGQYGGPSYSYSILIDKMVAKPNTDEYVDNLSVSDPRFAASQDVWFRVKVKNTSNQDITNVEVKDYVPSYLEPLQGPGTWDANTRIITWNAGDFAVDEEKAYYLKMAVYSQNDLPADKGLFCIVNKVDAHSDNTYDDDTSQLCIEKKVAGVTTVPSAGPEMGIILLSGELLALSAGLFINKKLTK